MNTKQVERLKRQADAASKKYEKALKAVEDGLVTVYFPHTQAYWREPRKAWIARCNTYGKAAHIKQCATRNEAVRLAKAVNNIIELVIADCNAGK